MANEAASASFVLTVELYVRPGQEAAFLHYEAEVLALFDRHGLKLESRIRHGEQAQGDGAPFETHVILVSSEAALAAYQSDPEREKLQALREQVLVRTAQRRTA